MRERGEPSTISAPARGKVFARFYGTFYGSFFCAIENYLEGGGNPYSSLSLVHFMMM
jgi:hypothetical protein